MFAEMRTGSNFLEANLNALPGVCCLGEMFNPNFIGKKDQDAMFGVDLALREADPLLLLRRLREVTPGLAGFRYFHDHDPRILPVLLDDPACAKIVLTRNPLESYVSWKIAQATGQWKLTNPKNLKTGRGRFDPAEFEAHVETLQAFQIALVHGLQVRGQTAFYIDYEDIQDLDVLNGLAGWLGVAGRLEAMDATLKKQNPEELVAKVTNPEEMERALARMDRFNLARTPNFEPRRQPAIPSFVAAEGAGLLYMPIRPGPEAAVRDWLVRIGGGLVEDFTQKSLRQWKRRFLPHRGFTVIRHPLLRGHAAFRTLVSARNRADLRQLLNRAHKADLPSPGEGFRDAGHERQAFLAFLRYAKLAAGGQTGQRVDAHLASQTAVLQGFAQFQPPDRVIREENLAEELQALAQEIGIDAPEITADAAAAEDLAAIWDPQLEDAAQEAWGRDYMGFGFSRWKV
jgi:hypothetical protein